MEVAASVKRIIMSDHHFSSLCLVLHRPSESCFASVRSASFRPSSFHPLFSHSISTSLVPSCFSFSLFVLTLPSLSLCLLIRERKWESPATCSDNAGLEEEEEEEGEEEEVVVVVVVCPRGRILLCCISGCCKAPILPAASSFSPYKETLADMI